MGSAIIKPLVTEKNTIHNAANIYVFEVTLKSDKTAIKSEVEKMFNVKVSSVRTLVCRGRSKRNKFGLSKVPYWKKALVALEPGQKIALFEGV